MNECLCVCVRACVYLSLSLSLSLSMCVCYWLIITGRGSFGTVYRADLVPGQPERTGSRPAPLQLAVKILTVDPPTAASAAAATQPVVQKETAQRRQQQEEGGGGGGAGAGAGKAGTVSCPSVIIIPCNVRGCTCD
eukprot:COSAG05_NODE_102_length_19076_cov_21.766612_8_plen_136_part_00